MIWNASVPVLYEHAVLRGQARIAEGGPFVVDTGKYTGRSPRTSSSSRARVGETASGGTATRRPPRSASNGCATRSPPPRSEEKLYVVDAFAGADPDHRIAVRVVTPRPYHALFAQTMFIDPSGPSSTTSRREALVLHAPGFEADPAEDGTRTGTFIVLHPTRRRC